MGVRVDVPLAVSVWVMEALWVVDAVWVTLGVNVAVLDGVRLCREKSRMELARTDNFGER